MSDTSRPRVLVADDQPDIIAALHLLLRSAGFEPHPARSVADVQRALAADEYDLLLMDLNYARDTTSGAEGLQLIDELHARTPQLPIIAMTGWANIETAVEAMRRGARGYLPKPWSNEGLVDAVRREIAEARAAQRANAAATREWSDAQVIQRALLPATLPAVPGCDLAARWEPASGFGGDYYDVMPLDGGAVAVCIADVCGKGLPAALLMSNLQATVRAFVDGHQPVDAAVRAINRALYRHAALGRFVTFVVAVLDERRSTLTYCNAGHNAPVLVRRGGGPGGGSGSSVVRLTAGGTVAGVFEDAAYVTGVEPIAPGDRLLLFTDGLSEARSGAGLEFGEERLVETVVRGQALRAADCVNQVFADACAFAGRPLQDDATALAMLVEG